MRRLFVSFCLTVWLLLIVADQLCAAPVQENDSATASASAEGFGPPSAADGNRFSVERNNAWKGGAGEGSWWWQVQFGGSREVGAILQVVGDHSFVLRNAPRAYFWQASDDGQRWVDLPETAVTNETRLFRMHRLAERKKARFFRLNITAVTGEIPTLREVEFYSDPQANASFPDWFIAVNTTHDSKLPNHGQEFISLAKSCDGWQHLEAQQIWVNDFNEEFLKAEPRPLCAFLSGNFKDLCEVNREWWRGTHQVLRNRNLPIWASCGGAQALAILADVGVEKPWGLPALPRSVESEDTDLHPHRTQRPASLWRLLRVYFRARTALGAECDGRSRVQRSRARVPGDGKPLRANRMAARRVEADRDSRAGDPDRDSMPAHERPLCLRSAIPYRDGGYSGNIEANHEELPRAGESLGWLQHERESSIRGSITRISNFSCKSHKATHNRRLSLVESMLDFHKKLAAARTPEEKTARMPNCRHRTDKRCGITNGPKSRDDPGPSSASSGKSSR
jgi:hypothetical protein